MKSQYARKRATLCSTVSIAPNAVSESENASKSLSEKGKEGSGGRVGGEKEEGREGEREGKRKKKGKSYLVLSYPSAYLQ